MKFLCVEWSERWRMWAMVWHSMRRAYRCRWWGWRTCVVTMVERLERLERGMTSTGWYYLHSKAIFFSFSFQAIRFDGKFLFSMNSDKSLSVLLPSKFVSQWIHSKAIQSHSNCCCRNRLVSSPFTRCHKINRYKISFRIFCADRKIAIPKA